MTKIIVCAADQLLKKVAEHKPAAVLSIEHPGVKEGEKGYAPRLTDGTPQMILTFWDSEHADTLQGPDLDQMVDGLAFIMEHASKGGTVIVHCKAGVSRSAAMALGALSLLHPRMDEEKLVEKLLEIRPKAGPNIIMVELLDMLAGRDGKLVEAVEDNKKISHTRKMAELGRSKWLAKNPETYKKMHPEKFPKP